MARRKKQPTTRPGLEFKIRLPDDIAERIEAKAKREQRPKNRIIINELIAIPRLEQLGDLADKIADMDVILAKHSARVRWQELSDELLAAVDRVLSAQGIGALGAAVDGLRVVRNEMLKTQAGGKN